MQVLPRLFLILLDLIYLLFIIFIKVCEILFFIAFKVFDADSPQYFTKQVFSFFTCNLVLSCVGAKKEKVIEG